MEGLKQIGTIPTRRTREECIILRDEPAYKAVKRYASNADMQEIDGWARSFYTLEGHLASIALFRKPLIPEPTDSVWIDTKQETFSKVSNIFPKVRSFQFEDEIDSVPYESSSAAGYGYMGRKGEGDNLKRAKRIANALVRTFDEQIDTHGHDFAVDQLIEQSTPDVAFTRTQLAKLPSIKVRIVFGEAFHYILLEGLSAAPLLAAFKSRDTFYFTGKDPTIHVPYILMEMGQQPGWFVCLDWKSFDATVQLWEIEHAFDCIESLIYFPTHLSYRAFQLVKESFKSRKLAAPDGTLYIRNGGIPSGSYFTSIIGSVINYVRIHYICKKLNYGITSIKVQGDDSITKVATTAKPDIWQMAETCAQLGWVLNPAKCTITESSEEVTFLGRSQLFQYNIRERLKVLRLMCFPEYEIDSPKISTTRVRMIARDAGFNDLLYNKIYYAMRQLYGEADSLPAHLRTYFDKLDFQDVTM